MKGIRLEEDEWEIFTQGCGSTNQNILATLS